MIPISLLETTGRALMAKAAIEIPDDYLAGLRRCADSEKGDLSAFVIQAMLENYEAAKEDRRAMCGDTGLPRWYVKIGNEACIEGGPVALETALRRATAKATQDVPLRPNRVHPLWRTDHNNNVGINAPEIEYAFHPAADWIDLTTVHKGGLFGTDYRMLFPGDGIEGIKRFYLDTLIGFGKRGLACQPAIVGVGLGGSKDTSVVLGKQASCLRVVGSRHPDPRIAALEDELKDARQLDRHGRDGLHGLVDGGRLPHRGRLLPHRRHADVGAHVLPVVAARHRARASRRQGRVPHRPGMVHRLQPPRDGGVGRAAHRRGGVTAVGAPLKTVRIKLPASTADLRALEIGSVAYLAGRLFTAREGVYKHAVEDGAGMPASREQLGIANFHCSPAASVNPDGSHTVGAVTATASFRFAKWLDRWFEISGCNIIIGKGGMTSEVYRKSFVPNDAVYLTTVGYGTGALLGRGIKRVAGVYWLEELGLAQAIWVLDIENFGPFLVESDLAGNSLFERENRKIAPGLDKLYAGTKPAILRRYGETDDKADEII
jgi:L(+)-tartrate dehydratase alpha subunit